MFKFKGIAYKVGNVETISDKFRKREFIVTDGADQYPQYIPFTFVNDKCDLLESIAEGQEVEVSFSLKGREWTSPQGQVKFFSTIEGFAITVSGTQAFAPNVAPSAPGSGHTDDQDLPF
jgi:cold shock CspA family protein